MKKKYALALVVALILCVFGTACFVCSLQYASARKDLLDSQKDALGVWVAGAAEAISLWVGSLEDQGKRISTSELYRLFAADVEQLGAGGALNDPDASLKDAPEGLASLAEQVPLMRNLLLDFMNFNGFSDARIVNVQGQTLLSALTRPTPVTPEQHDAVTRAVASGKTAFGAVRATSEGLMLDFADPLGAVLSQDAGEKPVAALLLTRPVTGQLAQFLARDKHQAGQVVPRLFQRRGGQMELIQVHVSQPSSLDAALLPLDVTGNLPFGRRVGLDGATPVYSLGLKTPGPQWWVALEIPAADVDERLRSQALMIYGIGGLISLGVVLLCALLWWIVIGREQRAVAQRFQSLYRVIKQQKQMLDSVNVSLDVGLLLTDVQGRILVCNRAFARLANREEAALPGMNLQALFAANVCGSLLHAVRRVAESAANASLETSLPGLDGEHLYRVTLFPYMESDASEKPGGAVAIFQDITEFRRNAERRRRQQVNTIAALVRAIESVDPYLSGHSQKMELLADLMCRDLGLEDRDRETVRTAASLSQMGKLFVPRDLLAKTGKLSPEEQAEIMRAPDYAYNVLRDIDFGMPVPRAVHEMSERMDGKGYPQHLQGDEICIHARVLAVANAFCAMVSPRSYRTGMSPAEALDRLRGDGSSFDPRVVKTLGAVLRTPEGEAMFRPGA